MIDEASPFPGRQAMIHRRLGGTARLELAFELSDLTRDLALAGLKARFPSMSPAELTRELPNDDGSDVYPRSGCAFEIQVATSFRRSPTAVMSSSASAAAMFLTPS